MASVKILYECVHTVPAPSLGEGDWAAAVRHIQTDQRRNL